MHAIWNKWADIDSEKGGKESEIYGWFCVSIWEMDFRMVYFLEQFFFYFSVVIVGPKPFVDIGVIEFLREPFCGHWTHTHTCVFPRCCWVDSRLLNSCDIHASTTYTESVANMVTSCHITKYVSHDMAIWLWCVFVCVNCLHNQTSKITRTHYNS